MNREVARSSLSRFVDIKPTCIESPFESEQHWWLCPTITFKMLSSRTVSQHQLLFTAQYRMAFKRPVTVTSPCLIILCIIGILSSSLLIRSLSAIPWISTVHCNNVIGWYLSRFWHDTVHGADFKMQNNSLVMTKFALCGSIRIWWFWLLIYARLNIAYCKYEATFRMRTRCKVSVPRHA